MIVNYTSFNFSYNLKEKEDDLINIYIKQILEEIDSLITNKAQEPMSNDFNIKFNNGRNIVEVKISKYLTVGELIIEYFEKTKTKNGTFIFNDVILSPYDTKELYETGLKDNSEIIVK